MLQCKIKPEIHHFDTCREFAEAFSLGEKDLIITNQYIYEPYFGALHLPCSVIFQEKYGTGEPSDEMIEMMYEDVKDISAERIIAIGGGTVLDISKLFALKKMSPLLDLIDGKIQPEKARTFLTVPTTCGTGSEVTKLSVMELKSRHTKLGFGVEEMYADAAILIPELLTTLPFRFFATSSLDAFIHAIESYLSPQASPYTRMYSSAAMEMILKGYQVIAKEGEEGRLPLLSDFLTASNYAGIAFSIAGCAAVHAMSYPLGGNYHVAHGESNYVMFTGVFRKYMEKDPTGKIDELNGKLAGWLGCEKARVYEELEKLFSQILPKKSLHEYGMTEKECETFAEIVVEKQTRLTNNNYVKLTKEDYVDIYRSLY